VPARFGIIRVNFVFNSHFIINGTVLSGTKFGQTAHNDLAKSQRHDIIL